MDERTPVSFRLWVIVAWSASCLEGRILCDSVGFTFGYICYCILKHMCKPATSFHEQYQTLHTRGVKCGEVDYVGIYGGVCVLPIYEFSFWSLKDGAIICKSNKYGYDCKERHVTLTLWMNCF